jgi:hypothetical protein
MDIQKNWGPEHRLYIPESEFDGESVETQMQYRYCPLCKRFYLKAQIGMCRCQSVNGANYEQ